ncbi:MAG: hypothetical protein JXR70_12935 [Spirochaetales bacterium]|nr:hypothetical protein [Spirochaetales bacterium]
MQRHYSGNNFFDYLFIFALIIMMPSFVFSQSGSDVRLAILDFNVQSANPNYQYLGKGFAEFLSVELDALKGIKIIDRSKRNEILNEQEFMLSGAADESSMIKVGQLLVARYLISGDIFDIFGELVITTQVVDIESGEIIASSKVEGEPSSYKSMISKLVSEIYSKIKPPAVVASVLVTVPETQKVLSDEQANKVLTGFSNAVDAVDNNDVETAKRQLEEVSKIDKDNKAVQFYLNKLMNISPKFNVELIFYAPGMNPGLLGFLNNDRLHFSTSTNSISPYTATYPDSEVGHTDFMWEFQEGTWYGYNQNKLELGYAFPAGKNLGIAFEIFGGMVDSIVRDQNYEIETWSLPTEHVYIRSGMSAIGGRLGFGAALNESFGIGASAYVFNSNMNLGGSDGEGDPDSNTISGSASLGIYTKPQNSSWFLEAVLSVPFLQEVYIDYRIRNYVAYKTAPYPIVLDTTFITSLIQNRLYLSTKEVLESYLSYTEDDDRFGLASRTIAAGEFWFNSWLSLRLGGEFDYIYLMDTSKTGWGLLGGISLKFGDITVDANVTWMERALRFYPGYTVPDLTLLTTLSYNGLFIGGKK